MMTSRSFPASGAASAFVRHFMFLSAEVVDGVQIRPVIARPDVVLAFNLQQAPVEAFEYRTAAARTLPRALLVGPQTARRADLLVTRRWSSFAIHLQPAAFTRLFRLPVSEFTDTAVDAVAALGDPIRTLHDRLHACSSPQEMVRVAERVILRLAAVAAPLHPTGRAAALLLDSHGRRRVGDTIAGSGLGERQFERCFVAHMGMTPKRYARVARLTHVIELKRRYPALTWAQISQDAGYFDQTHLVKDFKEMAGVAPGTWLRETMPGDDGFLLSSLASPA